MNFTSEITFVEVTKFQRFWNCLQARVCIIGCVSVLVLETETRQRDTGTPRSTGGTRGITGSLWPCLGVRGLCFSQQAVAYFSSSEIVRTVSHLPKLLSRIQPFNQTGLYFFILYVKLLLVHEHFQQLFSAFHHRTSRFLGAFSHSTTEASCLPTRSEHS